MIKIIICFLLTFFILPNFIFSQNRIFKYYKLGRETSTPEIKDTIIYYYLIDSTKIITYKKFKFFGFIFDNDTSKLNGYINFYSINNCIQFINLDDLNKSTDTSKIIQKIYTRKNNLVNHMGILGSKFILKIARVKKKMMFKIFHINPIPSHKIYFKKLLFNKNNFPEKLFLSEMGSSIVYEINCQSIK